MWFVELAPITDPAAVDEALAAAVGAQDRSPAGAASPPTPAAERAIDRLGDRSVIVILDNCEHVVDAAARLTARLLDGCRGLRIVATSREPLGLPGEHQVVLGALSDEDATSLFTERAEAVQPRFSADHGDVVELCRHLDGLPLAIELAAARTKALPVPEIAARLHDRFKLLTDSKRPGDGRQRGLRAAIDWSYDLLFEDEQRAFRRLAVFAGGVTTAAAEAVCGDDALDIVTRLVDKSLLVAETSGQTARFRMLESLRVYGLDRLAAAGELDDGVSSTNAGGAPAWPRTPKPASAARSSLRGSTASTPSTTTSGPLWPMPSKQTPTPPCG